MSIPTLPDGLLKQIRHYGIEIILSIALLGVMCIYITSHGHIANDLSREEIRLQQTRCEAFAEAYHTNLNCRA